MYIIQIGYYCYWFKIEILIKIKCWWFNHTSLWPVQNCKISWRRGMWYMRVFVSVCLCSDLTLSNSALTRESISCQWSSSNFFSLPPSWSTFSLHSAVKSRRVDMYITVEFSSYNLRVSGRMKIVIENQNHVAVKFLEPASSGHLGNCSVWCHFSALDVAA